MIIVNEKYKLIKMDIDGSERILPINPPDAWNTIECQCEDGTIIKVNEGDVITFITINGEIKKGTLTTIGGGKKNIALEIIPEGMEYKEIWESNVIRDYSLKVIPNNIDEEEETEY